MKKHLPVKGYVALLFCLAVALLFGAYPAQAAEHFNHSVCADTENCTDPSHETNHGNVTWTEWTDASSLPTTAGSYYLAQDVTISATWKVPPGTTQLCLNGHTIKYENDTTRGSVINVPEGVTLTITDCAETPGKIIGGTGTKNTQYNTSLSQGGHYGGGLYVQGVLNFYGGSIEDNKIPTPSGSDEDGGGGVFVDGGDNPSSSASFRMYGGVITDNAADFAGCGVLCHNATFDMYGGQINENEPVDNGEYYSGGVCVDEGSTMNMHGGTVSGHSTNNGQIYVCKDATLVIDGENVIVADESDDSGLYGFNGGKIEIKNGSVHNAVKLVQQSTLTMSGGVISDGIRIIRGSSADISGGKIQGTPGVQLSNDYSNYGLPAITLSGDPEISSIGLMAETKMNIKAELTYSKPINITLPNGGIITNGWSTYMANKNPTSFFSCTGYEIKEDNGELFLISSGGHLHDGILFNNDLGALTADNQGIYSITTAGNYCLFDDRMIGDKSSIETTLYIGDGTNDVTVSLCLHGKKLSRGENDTKGPVIIVRENATLNLYDCEKTGTITGGTGRTAEQDGTTYSYGGGIMVYGTLNMYGGSITGNSANADAVTSGFGGGVYVAPGAKFNMYDGSIMSNTAKATGGGVTVAGAGDAVPVSKPIWKELGIGGGDSDGIINEWKDGGTIEGSAEISAHTRMIVPRNANAGVFNLCGGSITENTATTAGGVNVRGTMIVDNRSQITVSENSNGNVYFPEPHTDLTVQNLLVNGSQLGVTMATPGQFATTKENVDESQARTFFSSDDPLYSVLTIDNGLKLGKQQATPMVAINYTNEMLTGFKPGVNYTINDEAVTLNEDGTLSIREEWFGKTLSIVCVGEGEIANSEPQTLSISDRPAAPSGVTGTVGQISGVTAEMEYCAADGSWQSCDGTTITGLSAGSYEVRYAATADSFASTSVTVTVLDEEQNPDPEPTPDPSEPSSSLYHVTIAELLHGSIDSNHTWATAGTKVTLEITPNDGYVLEKLTLTDEDGQTIDFVDNGDGTITFTMPSGDVTITATFAESDEPECALPFVDVHANDWFFDPVCYVYSEGLMTGTSATTFAPDATTTRAMIVSILARQENVTSAEDAGFTDVDENDWFATAVNWAAREGIVAGFEDDSFRPNAAITREQLAAILCNYSAWKGEDTSARADLDEYTDAISISSWATDTMSWAVAEGLISGMTADELQPQESATRAQVAAILQRYLEK